MGKLNALKQLCLSVGLYRAARILYRQWLNQAELEEFRQDVALYSELVEAGSLCFDVGANIGKKTEALLEAGAKVVAFEPQPSCMKELEARCSPYRSRLCKYQRAVGAEPGEATLYVHDIRSHSSLEQDWGGGSKALASIRVPVITLDQAIAQVGQPEYCKIDVEGWEHEVLKGLTQPIPLLSFEYHLQRRSIDKTLACLDYLSRFGELRINVTSGKISLFAFQEWLCLEKFLSLFPDTFFSRKQYNYGDIFVRIC